MALPCVDFVGICHDTTLALPIRQTASIFKQPVTVVRTRPEGKTKSDLKQGSQENQPRQVGRVWEVIITWPSLKWWNGEMFAPPIFWFYYKFTK